MPYNHIPFRVRLTRAILRHWPFRRGTTRIQRILLPKHYDWSISTDIDFAYGRFIDASLQPWPYGFQELYLTGKMEVSETNAWTKVLKPGDIVADGGANWGYFTLLASKLVGPTGTVHAFEPAPSTFHILERNLQASGIPANVVLHMAALARHDGKTTLNLMSEDPLALNTSLMLRTDLSASKQVVCQTISLDSIFNSQTPRLIKLDVEGAELTALNGAGRILSGNPNPVITFEWNHSTARNFGSEPRDIYFFLRDFGYSLFLFNKDQFVPFTESMANDSEQWIPMVWALSAQHQHELNVNVRKPS